MTRGLRLVNKYCSDNDFLFDWLIVLRYDLLYLTPINTWVSDWSDLNAPVYSPFRFIPHHPDPSVQMACDCFFCIGRGAYKSFIYQCYRNRDSWTNHLIYIPFRYMVPDNNYYTANTVHQRNPLYQMAGRPYADAV
jgi:hypothetical protein